MAHRSRPSREYHHDPKSEATVPPRSSGQRGHMHLPQFNHNGHKITPGIEPEGESGRRGLHPVKFLQICFRSNSPISKWVNVLWPMVPVAIALHFARPDLHLAIFITNYIAMVPAANMVGFAGSELARKLPKVIGVIAETTFGSFVEIILFMVLLKTSVGDGNVQVIRSAILGSILANMLLCLGFCFMAGGLKGGEQVFHEAISEAGSGLMLVAGMGLVIPTVYYNALSGRTDLAVGEISGEMLKISRATAIILLIAYLVYVFFQLKSHDNLFAEIYEHDEIHDKDRHKELAKPKLTLTECLVGLVISLACVSLIAIFLVLEIPFMVEERHISDAFVGLILVPVVEKAAEHLLAIDEAWDGQMNLALAHVLGASIQTALLNTPLVIIVGWGIGVHMDMQFEVFDSVSLILAILVVGSFLRDKKSNYLEGALCIFIYIIIAVSAFFYPNPAGHGGSGGETTGESTAHRMRFPPPRFSHTLSQVAKMGRVRTKTVKKSAKVIIERYYPKLSLDFETNKRICDEVAIIASKRLRNKIAGYATHLMKRIQRGPVRGISFKLQEEERERKDQYVPEISALDFTQNTESGSLSVDQETKDLLKSLGFDSIPVTVEAVSAQQITERGPRRFGDRPPRN
ncbi:hypothetical protein P280DRAFT_483444 [Massarina eburnea CBS 473.64]|uniref:Vacuolar calcium ion transporter n=1 Tax=Massarina eburnea CBS 473.64 TaxID=1395130 RepID=A0A6A6RQH7_9PLEO|nr:hypothetical protein P280DRAFT_483444 [Massarina eburnea CBS 473.64]